MQIEFYDGTVLLLPYNFEPEGSLICNGQLLNIQSYSRLFSLIGSKFGGDGRINFALPNMLGMEPIPGMNYFINLEGIYPQPL